MLRRTLAGGVEWELELEPGVGIGMHASRQVCRCQSKFKLRPNNPPLSSPSVRWRTGQRCNRCKVRLGQVMGHGLLEQWTEQ